MEKDDADAPLPTEVRVPTEPRTENQFLEDLRGMQDDAVEWAKALAESLADRTLHIARWVYTPTMATAWQRQLRAFRRRLVVELFGYYLNPQWLVNSFGKPIIMKHSVAAMDRLFAAIRVILSDGEKTLRALDGAAASANVAAERDRAMAKAVAEWPPLEATINGASTEIMQYDTWMKTSKKGAGIDTSVEAAKWAEIMATRASLRVILQVADSEPFLVNAPAITIVQLAYERGLITTKQPVDVILAYQFQYDKVGVPAHDSAAGFEAAESALKTLLQQALAKEPRDYNDAGKLQALVARMEKLVNSRNPRHAEVLKELKKQVGDTVVTLLENAPAAAAPPPAPSAGAIQVDAATMEDTDALFALVTKPAAVVRPKAAPLGKPPPPHPLGGGGPPPPPPPPLSGGGSVIDPSIVPLPPVDDHLERFVALIRAVALTTQSDVVLRAEQEAVAMAEPYRAMAFATIQAARVALGMPAPSAQPDLTVLMAAYTAELDRMTERPLTAEHQIQLALMQRTLAVAGAAGAGAAALDARIAALEAAHTTTTDALYAHILERIRDLSSNLPAELPDRLWRLRKWAARTQKALALFGDRAELVALRKEGTQALIQCITDINARIVQLVRQLQNTLGGLALVERARDEAMRLVAALGGDAQVGAQVSALAPALAVVVDPLAVLDALAEQANRLAADPGHVTDATWADLEAAITNTAQVHPEVQRHAALLLRHVQHVQKATQAQVIVRLAQLLQRVKHAASSRVGNWQERLLQLDDEVKLWVTDATTIARFTVEELVLVGLLQDQMDAALNSIRPSAAAPAGSTLPLSPVPQIAPPSAVPPAAPPRLAQQQPGPDPRTQARVLPPLWRGRRDWSHVRVGMVRAGVL